MRYAYALIILIASVSSAAGENAVDAEAGRHDSANRTVKLIGAGFSPSRTHHLCAKFLEVKPNPGTEIEVGFSNQTYRLAKTTVQKNHVSTIRNIIRYSVNWRSERLAPFTEVNFREPQFEVIFSIPKDTPGRMLDLDRWHLVSITSPEAKKEPPSGMAIDGAGEGPVFASHRGVRLAAVSRLITADRTICLRSSLESVATKERNSNCAWGLPPRQPTSKQPLT